MQNYAVSYRTKFHGSGGYATGRPAPKETITGPEIAELLNMKLETFQKRRDQLMRNGMPRPVPGTGARRSQKVVWSRDNVLAWINGAAATAARPGAAKDPVELAREALEARMGGAS